MANIGGKITSQHENYINQAVFEVKSDSFLSSGMRLQRDAFSILQSACFKLVRQSIHLPVHRLGENFEIFQKRVCDLSNIYVSEQSQKLPK